MRHPRPKPRYTIRMRPLHIVLLLVVLGLGIIGGSLAFDLYRFAYSPAVPGKLDPVIYEVKKGERPMDLARTLQEKGVIADAEKFMWLGKLTRASNQIRAAEYQFTASMTPFDVYAVLKSGISVQHPITIPEGFNLYEIADLLAEKGFGDKSQIVDLCQNPGFIQSIGIPDPQPSTLEGYLYPDTYLAPRTMPVEEILKRMVRRALTVWTPERNTRAQELGYTRDEIFTLASVIEKETGAASERPMISSIFHNRLQKKMRLESDPTIIYGVWKNYNGNLTKADIRSKTPYNTYVIAGLPIGPISNPGTEAIDAALHPVESEYLFFVSRNNGTHEFARTYAEHLENVKRFQLNAQAREGKSWRDLANPAPGNAAKNP